MDIATLQGCPVRESRSEYTQVALPNDANTRGNVLGGHIMHMVDLCGGIAACRQSRRATVTASVDHMSFLRPVHIGQLLILKSSVNRVFQSSMEIGVKVWVEDAITGEIHHVSSAYLTFVALDESGEPVSVTPLILETAEDKRRYEEAGRRRENRLRARAEQTTNRAAPAGKPVQQS